MKTKHITAAVLFVLTFGLSVLLVGVPESDFAFQPFEFRADNETAIKISFLLQQDDDNGREMEANLQSADSSVEYAEAVNQYVGESAAMDDTNLPADFRIVWRAHMKAWRAYADVQRRSALHINGTSGFSQNSEDATRADQEIYQTWLKVLKAARKYGAAIPDGAR